MKVVVLGASGMLGWMVLRWLGRDRALAPWATVRDVRFGADVVRIAPRCEVRLLDAETAGVAEIGAVLDGAAYAVNCIGVIKPYIRDDDTVETQRALRVNSLFPHLLARAAALARCHVLQIATDCVYSGSKGGYVETSPHDALDVYGKTKSLGEVHGPYVHHLRCSIIGPEPKGHVSLLDWFLRQPRGAALKGFTNHRWNGVTTLHFAKLCHGIVADCMELPHLQHVVPQGVITKAALLSAFARAHGRTDVAIEPVAAPTAVDRTLATANPDRNDALWRAAGHAAPPTVEEMVEELASHTSAPEAG